MTFKYLKSILKYDDKTGIFTWIVTKAPKAVIGSIAGTMNRGYIRISIDGKLYFAHRLAWFYMTGKMPLDQIDHKDRNRINNSFSNLREADTNINNKNMSLFKTNTSGHAGVYKVNNPKSVSWCAIIHDKGKKIRLGTFSCIGDAIIARQEAELKYNYGV